ncbi:MAG: 4-vinyl reductase [archaeon]
MFDFAAKLLMTKSLEFKDGEISLLKNPALLLPVNVVCSMIHELIQEDNYAVAYHMIYSGTKLGVISYSHELVKNFHLKKQELMKIFLQIAALAGYGKIDVKNVDYKLKRAIIHATESPVAQTYVKEYGRSKFFVDVINAGFFAGVFSILFEENVDCIELKCIARGDSECEFIVDSPTKISIRRKQVFEELKVPFLEELSFK